MNILIVEDYAEAAETFKELLEILGHQAQCVNDGGQVASMLLQHKFDLVFMDINLPDISGIELLTNLKKDLASAISEIRFVAISGYSANDPQGRQAAEVFDFYIEKPVDLARLDDILASYSKQSSV